MEKMIKVCVNGHEFKSNNNKLVCPKCNEPLVFKFVECPDKEMDQEEIQEKIREGIRTKNIGCVYNHLPRMEWFSEIRDNQKMERSGKKWSYEEISLLSECFEKYGVSTVQLWKGLAEDLFDRSIYGIEHMLRLFVANIDINNFFEVN